MPCEEVDVRWPLKGNRRMESNRPDESSSPTGSERLAVDAIFRSDTALRLALTDNLKPLRAESDATAARVDRAFEKFDLNPASPQKGARPQDDARPQESAGGNYVEHGTDIGEGLDRVILEGVDAFKSWDTRRAITFSDRAVLERLMGTAA
jgi:hypothetical protein